MIKNNRLITFCITLVFISIIILFIFETAHDSNLNSSITIDSNYKINFSDDLAFKETNYNDALWDNGSFSIKSVTKEKEHINKTVWVRKKIVIPSDLKENDIMLLVEGITNGYEIYLNGTLIGKSPIYPNQNFNVWNRACDYFIPKNIINFDSENVLAIRTFSSHEYGASRELVIGPSDSIQDKAHYINLWRIELYFVFIALMLTFSLYFTIGYYYNDKRKKQLMFAIVNFFAVIYYSNYIVYKLPISYLLYQKIIFISLHLMLISTVFFIMSFLHMKLPRIIKGISVIMAAVSIIGCGIAKNSVELYNFRTYYTGCFFLVFGYFTFLIIKSIANKNRDIFKLVFPIGVAIFAGSYDTLGQIFRTTPVMGIQLSGFAIILFFILVGFEMLKEYELLYRKARVDGLTGIYNHISFKNELEDLVSSAKIATKGVSLILYDIDNFKKINDIYGHSFGDSILKTVAKVISNNEASKSFAARYGGEEFVLLLTDYDKEMAIELSDRIREQISQIRFDYNNEKVKITISGGVTSMKEIKSNYSSKSFFDEADKAMYYSKNNGKNKITHYSDIL